MARRINPELNATRIIRPVTAPVDTFYNLAPLTQTAPVDTQSLEIAEALRELSPSLLRLGQSAAASEREAGVLDYTNMTQEQRKALDDLEARGGINPFYHEGLLEERGRDLGNQYRAELFSNLDELSDPYNADGTIRTSAEVQMRVQQIAQSVNVPNSHYIQRGFAISKRNADAEFEQNLLQLRQSKVKQAIQDQFSSRILEIVSTTVSVEEAVSSIHDAMDNAYKSRMIPDGARDAVYRAVASHIEVELSNPRLDEAEIERLQAILHAFMTPQTDEQGRPYFGVRGMPMPPELLASYERLQGNIELAEGVSRLRTENQAIQNYSRTVQGAFLTRLDSLGPNQFFNPTDSELKAWIAETMPNLSPTALNAVWVDSLPYLRAAIGNRTRPSPGLPPDQFIEMQNRAVRGELSLPLVVQDSRLSADQRRLLVDQLNTTATNSTPDVTAAVGRVNSRVSGLVWTGLNLSFVPEDHMRELADTTLSLYSQALNDINEKAASDPDLMGLRMSNPLEFNRQMFRLIDTIIPRLQEAMRDQINAAREASEHRLDGFVRSQIEPLANRYANDVLSVYPDPSPEQETTIRQRLIEEVVRLYQQDPRPVDQKNGLITSDLFTQAVYNLDPDRLIDAVAPETAYDSRSRNAAKGYTAPALVPADFVAPGLAKDTRWLFGMFGETEDYNYTNWVQATDLNERVTAVTDAAIRLERLQDDRSFSEFIQAKTVFQQTLDSFDFVNQQRTVIVRGQPVGMPGPTRKFESLSKTVPLFQYRPDGVYALPESQYFGSGGGLGQLTEKDFNEIDLYRVKSPEALKSYLSWKAVRFGDISQLEELRTSEGVSLSPGYGDEGKIQIDPITTRFFNSEQELQDAVAQFNEDRSGPLNVILEYVQFKVPPQDVIEAQSRLIFHQIP